MDWIELGELAEISNGYAFKSKKYKDVGIRIIRITNVQKGYIEDSNPKFYSETDMKGLERFYLFEEDILISLTGNVGRVARVTKEILPAALNQRVASIKPKERINNDYLFYMMNSNEFEGFCITESNGVAQKNLGTTALSKMKIPVPSIEIQNKIVEVLDHAQNLIDNRKEQLRLLDNLIESIFYDMFGDPVSNNKRWEVKKLGELGNLGRGKSKHRPRNHFSLYGGKYPFIQTGDVSNAGIYLDSFETTYSEKGLEQSKIWNKNTLCITIAANIAKTSILKINACFPDSIVGFISNEYSNVIYIRTWFLFFQEIIEKAAPQSAQRNINLRILNDLDIIAPPISLQNEFAEKVQAIEEQKELMSQSLKLMEDNYNSLMQRAFKGDLF